MTSTTHIELSELRVSAGTRELLAGLSLDLHGGECVGLVGESGSGKSLTSLALLGLLPTGLQGRAQLRVDGQAIDFDSREHAELRGRVFGLVPQDPLAALHPLRRVGAQLLETLRVTRGMSRRGWTTGSRSITSMSLWAVTSRIVSKTSSSARSSTS